MRRLLNNKRWHKPIIGLQCLATECLNGNRFIMHRVTGHRLSIAKFPVLSSTGIGEEILDDTP
jgi:hypothetical protein